MSLPKKLLFPPFRFPPFLPSKNKVSPKSVLADISPPACASVPASPDHIYPPPNYSTPPPIYPKYYQVTVKRNPENPVIAKMIREVFDKSFSEGFDVLVNQSLTVEKLEAKSLKIEISDLVEPDKKYGEYVVEVCKRVKECSLTSLSSVPPDRNPFSVELCLLLIFPPDLGEASNFDVYMKGVEYVVGNLKQPYLDLEVGTGTPLEVARILKPPLLLNEGSCYVIGGENICFSESKTVKQSSPDLVSLWEWAWRDLSHDKMSPEWMSICLEVAGIYFVCFNNANRIWFGGTTVKPTEYVGGMIFESVAWKKNCKPCRFPMGCKRKEFDAWYGGYILYCLVYNLLCEDPAIPNMVWVDDDF